MAVNWHRRKWVVQSMFAGVPAPDVLFRDDPGASNEFWLDPVVAAGNLLGFTVGFAEGAMEFGWQDWILLAKGTDKFLPPAAPTPATERLEGERVLEGALRALRLYVEVLADGTEQLHIKLGVPGSSGSDGVAIARPR